MDYVQIRFESRKSDKALGMILHNTRKIKPSYLRQDMAHNRECNTIFINKNGTFEQIEIKDKAAQTLANNKLKKQLKELTEREKTFNKNFREKKHAIVQDCVITLSNSINKKYENGEIDKQKLNILFVHAVNQISKKLNLEALYVAVHWDEKTPHVHVSFKNYYRKKSISNELKKNYSQAQDIMGSVFKEIGYQRGQKKEITQAKHLKVQEMHIREKEEIIKENEEKIAKLEAIKNWQLEKIDLDDFAITSQKTQKLLTTLEKLLIKNEQKNYDHRINF